MGPVDVVEISEPSGRRSHLAQVMAWVGLYPQGYVIEAMEAHG